MEREQWQILLLAIKPAARQIQQQGHPIRLRFGDWLIVAMYF